MFRIGRKPKKSVKTYVNPVKVAFEYQEMLDSVGSKAELAEKLGVSRAKVTQMLNLLKLDDEILEFLVSLEDIDKRLEIFTERRLRGWVELSRITQLANFRNMVDQIQQ